MVVATLMTTAGLALFASPAAALMTSAPVEGSWPSESEILRNEALASGVLLGREGSAPVDDPQARVTAFAAAKVAAKAGGLPAEDTDRLLNGARQAAGPYGGTFILTVTDGGMVDMAQNMLRSLDAVPSHARRLVVGMGADICEAFGDFAHTTCVEVFKESSSEEEVAWGSHNYWQVVFRKHAILTVVAVSNVSRGVIYTDPDIVYLDSPVGYMNKLGENYDILFSPNNMLENGAQTVEDLSPEYETRGLTNTTLGPHKRRVDINTGLFYMRSSDVVTKLMVDTLTIFKEQEFVHGHYQQYSLVHALQGVPEVNVGVAAGDTLVNGNVFWGHRAILRPGRVISVHANWMQPDLKRPCFKSAGLWINPSSPHSRQRLTFEISHGKAKMDIRGATIVECHS